MQKFLFQMLTLTHLTMPKIELFALSFFIPFIHSKNKRGGNNMKNQGCLLWELQELDKKEKVLEAKDKVRNLAKWLKVMQEDIKTLKSTSDEIEAEILKLSEQQKETSLELNKYEDEIKNNNEKLYDGKTNNVKELSNLQYLVEDLNKSKRVIEETLIKIMVEIEERQLALSGLKNNIKKQYKEYKNELAKYQTLQMELELVDQTHKMEREDLVAQIDSHNLKLYNEMQSNYNNLGIAKMAKGICSGCRLSVSRLHEKKLKNIEDILYCENCGRIIVYF